MLKYRTNCIQMVHCSHATTKQITMHKKERCAQQQKNEGVVERWRNPKHLSQM